MTAAMIRFAFSSDCEDALRHLWTTVTTENTVTHDAGEPEWLDLPLTDYVVPGLLGLEDLPLRVELETPWLLQSRWLMEEADVGRPLVPIIEYRDPLGFALYSEPLRQEGTDELFMSQESTAVPLFMSLRWKNTWYTVLGLYTFIVRWAGSPANRETGRFSLLISESD